MAQDVDKLVDKGQNETVWATNPYQHRDKHVEKE